HAHHAPPPLPTRRSSDLTQIVAAVVSPRTALRCTKIMPPPRNPMPDTIWAAIRDGSSATCRCASRFANPYANLLAQRHVALDPRSEEHTSELQSLAYLVC